MSKPDEVRIANRATYWPVAPIDLVVGAPLVVRALLGVTPLGRVVQAAVLGAYLASAARDWHDRRGIRRIDFRREFGADFHHLVPMPREDREAEVRTLTERLNDEFVPQRRPRRELAVEVDRHLTHYIASITGQRVRTSTEVRGFSLAKLAFPFALGACDALSSDIAIFKDTGPLEPHQRGAFERLAAAAPLRPELGKVLGGLGPPATKVGRGVEAGMRQVYHTRMRVTGQTGLSDYDLGFTNFLYTFEASTTARQTPPAA